VDSRVPAELERKIDEAIGHYPPDQKRSAALPLLHLWQEHFGLINDDAVTWIAAKLGLQPINIFELVTFYPMLREKRAGKTHIRVCRTLSCAMAGSYQVMENLCAATGIQRKTDLAAAGHTPISVSPDRNYSIEFVECLASCGTAPVCMVNDDLHENVQPDNAMSILSNLRTNRSCLRRTRSSSGSFSRTSDVAIGRPTLRPTWRTAVTTICAKLSRCRVPRSSTK